MYSANWSVSPVVIGNLSPIAVQSSAGQGMVDILGAVLTDGLDAVEAACSEALAHSVHSAGVILNILARHREPPPPLTITTPDALKAGL